MSIFHFIFISFILGAAFQANGMESAAAVAERKRLAANTSVENKSELDFFMGAEFNGEDGAFGQFAFGLFGIMQLPHQMTLEGDYVRGRESGMRNAQTLLDDAYLALRGPVPRGPSVGVSFWSNHFIDMDTNAVGVEVGPRSNDWSVAGFFGSASRAGSLRNFRAVQLSGAQQVRRLQISETLIFGNIGLGWYKSLGLSFGMEIPAKRLPFNLSLDFQDNSFAFGKDSPLSEVQREFVIIAGLQFSIWGLL